MRLPWWLREFCPLCPPPQLQSHTIHSLSHSSSSPIFSVWLTFWRVQPEAATQRDGWLGTKGNVDSAQCRVVVTLCCPSVIRPGWLEGLATFQEMFPNHQDVILLTSNAVEWVCRKKRSVCSLILLSSFYFLVLDEKTEWWTKRVLSLSVVPLLPVYLSAVGGSTPCRFSINSYVSWWWVMMLQVSSKDFVLYWFPPFFFPSYFFGLKIFQKFPKLPLLFFLSFRL